MQELKLGGIAHQPQQCSFRTNAITSNRCVSVDGDSLSLYVCVCVCTRYGGDSMVVCNDWHSALVPMFIHAEKSTNPSIASAA